ncbi:MAG: hypothetical protein P1Q69_02205 [Candidatus Thorarchaeota archaeon]|nr:hypothetical protein [Candidatus Thorarchaeota archaeon]
MSTGQTVSTQLQLGDAARSEDLTVFCPPGISVETAKYPILMSGILAATRPSDCLSLFDHPIAWRRLDREAIFSMRRQLYRFLIPTDARTLLPKQVIETLQTIALSVSPLAIGVEASTLPPRRLHTLGGQLPASPSILIKSLEILSEPEISLVAQKISQKDIPAAESIVQLFGYDYSLEQIARMIATGLLGKTDNRRLVPMKNAQKIAIDNYIDHVLLNLSERPTSSAIRLHKTQLYGDSFTIVAVPGEPRVDYLRVEISPEGMKKGYSFESTQHNASDSKTSLYADHARFSAYQDLNSRHEREHMFIFHLSRDQRNASLGPWLPRAGVSEALSIEPVYLDSIGNMQTILESVLYPNFNYWSEGIPLMQRLGMSYQTELERIISK